MTDHGAFQGLAFEVLSHLNAGKTYMSSHVDHCRAGAAKEYISENLNGMLPTTHMLVPHPPL
jgi:hypothetical protein